MAPPNPFFSHAVSTSFPERKIYWRIQTNRVFWPGGTALTVARIIFTKEWFVRFNTKASWNHKTNKVMLTFHHKENFFLKPIHVYSWDGVKVIQTRNQFLNQAGWNSFPKLFEQTGVLFCRFNTASALKITFTFSIAWWTLKHSVEIVHKLQYGRGRPNK